MHGLAEYSNYDAIGLAGAGLAIAPSLQAPQQSGLATRRVPELPSDHPSGVPDRALVWTSAPEVNMPAEAVNLDGGRGRQIPG